MTVTALATQPQASLATLDAETMKELVAGGDCSRLSDAQKIAYYQARCESAGLDPRAQPFAFTRLNNKLVLYALKACSDQLTAKHGLSTKIVGQETVEGVRVVTAEVHNKEGRSGEDIGAVSIKGLTGEALANALMKGVTKAKRRAVLSFCGLGMLDETEVESIPSAQPAPSLVESGRLVLTEEGKKHATERAAANVTAAAEVLQSEPVKPPLTVDALWKKAGETWPEDERGRRWGAARHVLGLGKSTEWTQDDIDAMADKLFEPESVPF